MNCPSLIEESVSPTAFSTMSLLDPELVLLLPIHNMPRMWISSYPPVEWLSANQIIRNKLIARSKFDMLKALLIPLHTFSITMSYY